MRANGASSGQQGVRNPSPGVLQRLRTEMEVCRVPLLACPVVLIFTAPARSPYIPFTLHFERLGRKSNDDERQYQPAEDDS